MAKDLRIDLLNFSLNVTYLLHHMMVMLTSLSLLSSSGALSVAAVPCFSTSISPLVALELEGSSLKLKAK